MSLRELQENMVDQLYKDDTDISLEEFKVALADSELNPDSVNPEGWRLTHLIMLKLRFERLTHALPELKQKFEEKPQEFLELFKAYHREYPAKTFFPDEEKETFLDFFHKYPKDIE